MDLSGMLPHCPRNRVIAHQMFARSHAAYHFNNKWPGNMDS